jgi:hypothetical protein
MYNYNLAKTSYLKMDFPSLKKRTSRSPGIEKKYIYIYVKTSRDLPLPEIPNFELPLRNSPKGKCLRYPCKEDTDCPNKSRCQEDFISKFCSGINLI